MARGIWGWHSYLMPMGSTIEMSASYGEDYPPPWSKHMHGNVVEGHLFESSDKWWILCLCSCGTLRVIALWRLTYLNYTVSRDVGAKPSGECSTVHVDWKVSGRLWHCYRVTVVKWGGSVVIRSSFCSYIAVATGCGCVVCCRIRLSRCLKHLQMKNTDMHFVNGFLNGNCRVAAVKYRQRHTLRRNSAFQRMRDRTQTPSSERIQNVNSGGVNKAMFWQQCIEAQVRV